jgi:hypothetical protein
MPELTKQGHPRKRAIGAGRKPALIRKVRLTVNILPTTRDALGKRPGAMLDGMMNAIGEATQPAQTNPENHK